MKLIKNIAALFCAFVLSGIVSFADVPSSMPIGSLSALRAYAIESARQFDVSVSSSTSVEYGSAYRTWSDPVSGAELLKLVAASDLRNFSVANPKDGVWLYANVGSRDGDTLFSAYKDLQPRLIGSTWSLPSDAGNLKLVLANEIPIPVDGAVYALLKGNDAVTGQTVDYQQVRVENGKVYFPKSKAGDPSMTLWVMLDQGINVPWKALVYSAKDGTAVAPVSLPLALNPGIEGLYTFKNSFPGIITVPSSGGVGINPTIELTVDYPAAIIVYPNVMSSEAKYPVGYWMKKQGVEGWTKLIGPNPAVNVSSGVYYLVPEWRAIDFKDPVQPYYPFQGDGGGKG
jgi:hypothetical protein